MRKIAAAGERKKKMYALKSDPNSNYSEMNTLDPCLYL